MRSAAVLAVLGYLLLVSGRAQAGEHPCHGVQAVLSSLQNPQEGHVDRMVRSPLLPTARQGTRLRAPSLVGGKRRTPSNISFPCLI